jgi:myo-inositol-1(or 4)-monophosphatase
MRELLSTARAAADAATGVHREHLGRIRIDEADQKGHSDFVSHVDLKSQAAALGVIRERFPHHRILAEEEDGSAGPSSWREGDTPVWIVDPLDGTTNFLHGHPAFCASVGVLIEGRPEAGAVATAATGEAWWAARGEGAFRNGERIRVSGLHRLDRALVGSGFPFKRMDLLETYVDQLGRVLRSTSGVRRGGSAGLDLCYLAQGSFDVFWELFLSPWDVAGGTVILQEAGGIIRRPGGVPMDFGPEGGAVLAGNSPALLDALEALLEGAPSPPAPG